MAARLDDDCDGIRGAVLAGSTGLLGAFESVLRTARPYRIRGTGSIDEDVFMVRHRGGLDQEITAVEGQWGARTPPPPWSCGRGPDRGEGGRSTPQVEMAEDLLDGDGLFDQGDEAHWACFEKMESKIEVSLGFAGWS